MKFILLFSNLLLPISINLLSIPEALQANPSGCGYNDTTVPIGTKVGNCVCTNSGWKCT